MQYFLPRLIEDGELGWKPSLNSDEAVRLSCLELLRSLAEHNLDTRIRRSLDYFI